MFIFKYFSNFSSMKNKIIRKKKYLFMQIHRRSYRCVNYVWAHPERKKKYINMTHAHKRAL